MAFNNFIVQFDFSFKLLPHCLGLSPKATSSFAASVFNNQAWKEAAAANYD